MNIAIDIRCLQENKITGVGEYAYQLIKHLTKNNSENHYYFFANSITKIELPAIDNNHVHLVKFSWPNKLLNLLIALTGYPKLNKMMEKKIKRPIDLFIFPNLNFISVTCPYLITCHDLSFHLYPEFFSLKSRLWHWLTNPKKIYSQAKNVVCVSHNTKNDLIKHFNITPNKVTVIYPGIDPQYRIIDFIDPQKQKIREKYSLPQNFVLYLGTLEYRKNIDSLIRAFDDFVAHQANDAHLVLAGKPGHGFNLIKKTRNQAKHKNKIHFINYIEASDKVYLYNMAKVFAFPSYYEGFGLPPLEAMNCGVPIITSAVSSLPEILKTNAYYIDPYNINSLSSGLKYLWKNSTNKNSKTTINNYHWDLAIKQFLSLI